MVDWLKEVLYFPLASYFRFFASIRLRRWNPRVIVVTGSNGKTTLLHMLEAQIGDKAKYSHHANTSFGIPFDILDLHKKNFSYLGWINLFLEAPFSAFKNSPKEKIYIVEADAYRPGVGKFVGELLRPEVVLWVSTGRTHSMNFDRLVAQGKFKNVEEAIAYEHGYFLEYCSKLAVINGDSELSLRQKDRTKAEVKIVTKEKDLKKFSLTKEGTIFELVETKLTLPYLLPEEIFYSINLCKNAIDYLDIKFDQSFSDLVMPPGRGTIFEGIKDTTLIDSTYNANLGSISVVLKMFADFPEKKKWVVISDMLELGQEEKEEHEKLAEILKKMNFEKIILFGKRTAKYTYEKLKKTDSVISFQKHAELKTYLQENLNGGEAVLFKGSQSTYLEGIIESLLKNKSDAQRLPRRGEFWERMRRHAEL